METRPTPDFTKINLKRYKIILVTENGNQLARIVPRFKKPITQPRLPYKD